MIDYNTKHAYLIIAHKNIEQLSILIRLLDDRYNDIYIHIDRNAKWSQKDLMKIKKSVMYSNLCFINSTPVTWGGFSLVSVEIDLLKIAINNCKYAFYHLLSGQDLPIKSQRQIHDFFDANKDKEFIRFGSNEWINNVCKRLKYYWIFQEIAGNSKRFDKRLLRQIDRISVSMQTKIGINRISDFDFSAGHQWFSITDEFARYVVSQADFVRNHFKLSFCSDECFVQVLIQNSEFRNNIYNDDINKDCICNMRCIDWKRGSPYVFRVDDYDFLCNSECFFARC